MLGLGVGVTTAMATIVDALVIRRLPFEHPEQLAQLTAERERGGRLAFAWPAFRALRSVPGFQRVEGVALRADVTVASPAGPIVLHSATVTPGLLVMLGVVPTRGRPLVAEDGRSGTDNRVLVSEDAWSRVSGARAFVSGTAITVNGNTLYAVGLMPHGFRFPDWNTTIWRAADPDAPPPGLANDYVYAYARFAPSVAREEVLALATRAADGLDSKIAGMTIREWPIAGRGPDAFFSKAVPVIGVAVALVFIVLCANVASLLLAQLTARRREYGMCTALGASRGRLMREALLESAALACAGAIAGVALAWVFTSLARGYLPAALVEGTLNTVDLDGRSLTMAVIAGACATFIAGLVPAWIGTRVDPAEAMSGGRSLTEGRAARAATRGLLVSEIALACVLLTGATLLVRSFVNIATASRGLDVSGVVTTWVSLDKTVFKDARARSAVATSVEQAARAIPGVAAVALSLGTPPGGGSIHFGDGWRSDAPGEPQFDMTVTSYGVGPDFFRLYDIPILRGRTFTATDADVDVIVGERLARTMWPGIDPVGRSFVFDAERYHVIGVARELVMPTLDAVEKDRPEFYARFAPGHDLFMVSLKCAAACPTLPEIQQRLASVAAGITTPISEVPDATYAKEIARPRAAALLGGAFALIAVITAAGGLFSVLSLSVSRQRRELGIRTALGATQAQIRELVLLEGARTALIGLLIGGGAAWFLARALSGLQYEVSRNDPQTWIAVFVVIGVTTLAACWLPARRAGSVDVVALMREE